MRCKKCGAEIEEGKIYCEKCGADIQIVPDYNPEIEEKMEKTLAGIVHKEFGKKNKETTKKQKEALQIKVRPFPFVLVLGMFIAAVFAFGIWFGVHLSYQNTYEYQISTAEKHMKAGEYEDAIRYLKKASEINPGDVELRLQTAAAYNMAGNENEAISVLYTVLELDASNLEAYRRLIAIFEKTGEIDKIISLLEACENQNIKNYFTEYFVDEPKVNLDSGSYEGPIKVTLTSTYNETVYYTLDGSDITKNSQKYSKPIQVSEGTTILRAKCVNKKGIESKEILRNYVVKSAPPSAPTVLPESGKYAVPEPVKVSVPYDCKAYYTVDGTTPTQNSEPYLGPLDMLLGNNVISVVIYDQNNMPSPVTTRHYTLQFESTYEAPEAISILKTLMYARGELLDFAGHAPNISGNYIFSCSTATSVNGQIFYLVSQKHVSVDSTITPMEYQYAFQVDTAEIYRAYPDGEGGYSFEAYGLE